MGSPIQGVARLLLYLLWFGIMMPAQGISVTLGLPWRRKIPNFFHKVSAWILGLRIIQVGDRSHIRPTLFISNHSSYLDIEVLGAVIDGSFIAKAEVAKWPLFGILARLQETIFVDRNARRQVATQSQAIHARLDNGDNLILFPEGTSSDGNRILPFKTALFAVATDRVAGQPLTIQPVSVTAVAMDGIPLGRTLRPVYAWYGDMELMPHLWSIVQMGQVTVVVEFHKPVNAADIGGRKALAEHCRRAIAAGVDRAIAGRLETCRPDRISEEDKHHPGRVPA